MQLCELHFEWAAVTSEMKGKRPCSIIEIAAHTENTSAFSIAISSACGVPLGLAQFSVQVVVTAEM